MEFSKFRDSGDFSDITIVVDSKEYNLHKFPLCAKSEYFCEIAKLKSGGSAKVDLKCFPGGKETFERIADFCYNMPMKLSKDNIIETRLAAGYLKMSGSGNLIEAADKCLKEMLTSTRLSRSDVGITELLSHCAELSDLAESEGIADICIDALIECWVKKFNFYIGGSNVFTRMPKSFEAKSAFWYIRDKSSSHHFDEDCVKNVMSVKPDWLVKIVDKARDKGLHITMLGALVERYITYNVLQERDDCKQENATVEKSKARSDTHEKDSLSTNHQENASVENKKKPCGHDDKKTFKEFDDAKVLDTIILSLPEQAYRIPSITIEWMSKLLRLGIARDCQCRDLLVRLAGELMYKLDPDDLCFISPAVLHDIVQNKNNENKSGPQSDQTCKLVDTYMNHMNLKGVLTSETFRLLVSATSKAPRPSHDNLFNLLQIVLQTEKDSLTSDQRRVLTALIDANLLSETCLQKALDENILPAQDIAKSALKLCSRLRAEQLTHKYRSGEDNYRKYRSISPSQFETNEARQSSAISTKEQTVDSGYTDTSESSRSPRESSRTDGIDLTDHSSISEPLTAAQSVLITARHKLASFKPTTRKYNPVGSLPYTYHYSGLGDCEGMDEDLEMIHDRSFNSLDPRVHHYRIWGHYPFGQRSSGVYFPYTAYSRF